MHYNTHINICCFSTAANMAQLLLLHKLSQTFSQFCLFIFLNQLTQKDEYLKNSSWNDIFAISNRFCQTQDLLESKYFEELLEDGLQLILIFSRYSDCFYAAPAEELDKIINKLEPLVWANKWPNVAGLRSPKETHQATEGEDSRKEHRMGKDGRSVEYAVYAQ